MEYIPQYWNDRKGEIIKAIALDWCFTFREVQEKTRFEREELYRLIGELMSEQIIYYHDEQYKIEKELYYEYWDYSVHFTDFPEQIEAEYQETKENETQIIDWVKTWIDFQRSPIRL